RRPGGRTGVEEVIRRGLERQTVASGDGEVGPVPARAALVVEREVLDLFAHGRRHGGVFCQVPVERRRPAALGAEYQEVGRGAQARRGAAELHAGGGQRTAKSPRQAVTGL